MTTLRTIAAWPFRTVGIAGLGLGLAWSWVFGWLADRIEGRR